MGRWKYSQLPADEGFSLVKGGGGGGMKRGVSVKDFAGLCG